MRGIMVVNGFQVRPTFPHAFISTVELKVNFKRKNFEGRSKRYE